LLVARQKELESPTFRLGAAPGGGFSPLKKSKKRRKIKGLTPLWCSSEITQNHLKTTLISVSN